MAQSVESFGEQDPRISKAQQASIKTQDQQMLRILNIKNHNKDCSLSIYDCQIVLRYLMKFFEEESRTRSCQWERWLGTTLINKLNQMHNPSTAIILEYNSLMGCKNCKIGIESDETPFVPYSPQSGILTNSDKQIWLDNLTEPQEPEDNFYHNYRNAIHTCFNQIKKDTARSFPACQFFYSKVNLDRFQTLLKKFAIYFPKVGYTQGLNFLAGYILIAGFDNDTAFMVLVRMALNEKLMAIGLYEDKFPLNKLYCALFWKLLEKRQNSTAMKIKLAGVLDEIWIFQWFMTFFLYSFPVEFVKKFFDYIICKKQFAMVTLALGIVNCLKADILNLKDPDEFDFFQLLDNLKIIEFCESRINIDKVISYANSVTKYEITKALEEIKLPKNIYYTYFRRENERPTMWQEINQKLIFERRLFQTDPKSSQYVRDLNSVEHLERLLLRKSRLYRSRTDSKFSSQIRTSNFTVDFGEGAISTISEDIQNRIKSYPNNLSKENDFNHLQLFDVKLQNSIQLNAQDLQRNQDGLFMIREDSTSMSKQSRNNIGSRNL